MRMQTAFCNVFQLSRAQVAFCKHLICQDRLREVVKCVLFTFNIPTGMRSKRVNSCFFSFCFVWVIYGKDFVHLGIFIRNLMLLSGGPSGLSASPLIVM